MTKTAVKFTQAQIRRAVEGAEKAGLVYFVQIGKFIKIGFTTKLQERLATFATSSPDIELLFTVPGERALEQQLHQLFAECRVQRELFRPDWRITGFIRHCEEHGLEHGLQYLKETTPAARSKKKAEAFERRVAQARQTKAEKDAYFASLVAQRKERLGW